MRRKIKKTEGNRKENRGRDMRTGLRGKNTA